jgi:hypothetical protein
MITAITESLNASSRLVPVASVASAPLVIEPSCPMSSAGAGTVRTSP